MARQGGVKAYNNFVKGIITEASALSFPENASLAEANFLLNTDGSRQRRLGMDVDDVSPTYATGLTATDMSPLAHSSFKWQGVGGDANLVLGLVQVGTRLWAFDLGTDEPVIMGLVFTPYLDLSLLTDGFTAFQYAAVNGDVVISMGTRDPLRLYKTNIPFVPYGVETLSLSVRDFLGVEGEDLTTQPTTLSSAHKYNLLNQGWTVTNMNAYQASTGKWPSSTQSWYTGKDADDNFDPSLLVKFDFGNSAVAKGHYIIDAFSRGESRTDQSGIALPVDREEGNIGAVTVHAGRMFYAGVISSVASSDDLSPRYNGWIFFSQTLENNDKLSRCYQEGDPTTEFVGDVIATDGGTIPLPDATRIIKLVSTKDALIVLAENGVWQVNGAESGFLATEYQVAKITTAGVLGAGSVIEVEGGVLYWSEGGIYSLQLDPNTGLYAASNLTETTIQTLYNNISGPAKVFAAGSYDIASKKASWLYNDSSTYDGASYRYNYDTELILNGTVGAFSKHTISSLVNDSPYITGSIGTDSAVGGSVSLNVIVGADEVVAGADDVIATTTGITRGISRLKYTVITPSSDASLNLGYYKEETFKDWYSIDSVGINYSSFLITGHELYGDVVRKKQVPYLFSYFKRTETGFDELGEFTNPSSCNVQAQWAWTDSEASGRWGKAFQAYRLKRLYISEGTTLDYGHEVIQTKSKLRGKGEALSLNIYSEEGRDMHLLGWATSMVIGAAP